MEELTEKTKRIYNTYLKFSRYGKPYQYRKNFDNLSDYIILNLKKLETFFSKYPHININNFFEAPISIYPDNPYPKLDYFNTRVAIRVYSLFNKKKEDENPENQSDSIKEGFSFMGMFCIKNKITIDQYLNHKTGITPTWLDHYRQRKINPYCLMEIGDIIRTLDDIPSDVVDLFSENFNNKIVTFKVRYNQSNKTIALVKQATNKIREFVKKQLQK